MSAFTSALFFELFLGVKLIKVASLLLGEENSQCLSVTSLYFQGRLSSTTGSAELYAIASDSRLQFHRNLPLKGMNTF